MVAIVDDAYACIDMLADGCRTCSDTRDTLVVAMNLSVVVGQKVVPDVVDMLIVVFAIVTAAVFTFRNALSHCEPCRRLIQVTLVIQDFVHMVCHLILGGAAETSHDHFVVVVVAGQLTVLNVTIAGIASGTCSGGNIDSWNLSHVANQKDVGQVRMGGIIGLEVRLYCSCSIAGYTGSNHCCRATNLLFPSHKGFHGGHEGIVADDEQFAVFGNGCVSAHRLIEIDVTAFINGLELWIELE